MVGEIYSKIVVSQKNTLLAVQRCENKFQKQMPSRSFWKNIVVRGRCWRSGKSRSDSLQELAKEITVPRIAGRPEKRKCRFGRCPEGHLASPQKAKNALEIVRKKKKVRRSRTTHQDRETEDQNMHKTGDQKTTQKKKQEKPKLQPVVRKRYFHHDFLLLKKKLSGESRSLG